MYFHLNVENLSIAAYASRPIPEQAYRYQLQGKPVISSMEKKFRANPDPEFFC